MTARKNSISSALLGYVGFLDDRPHVQLEGGSGGPRTLQVYLSQRAARRAYCDVRKVRLVFNLPPDPLPCPWTAEQIEAEAQSIERLPISLGIDFTGAPAMLRYLAARVKEDQR